MMRMGIITALFFASGCTSPPPPEAWEAANVMAQAYADRVQRLKRKEPRRAQQVAAEGILLSYQQELAPTLRDLCGSSCVVAIEYRFGALRLAYQEDDGPVDAEREALVLLLEDALRRVAGLRFALRFLVAAAFFAAAERFAAFLFLVAAAFFAAADLEAFVPFLAAIFFSYFLADINQFLPSIHVQQLIKHPLLHPPFLLEFPMRSLDYQICTV